MAQPPVSSALPRPRRATWVVGVALLTAAWDAPLPRQMGQNAAQSPVLAFAAFEDSTLGGFRAEPAGTVRVVPDPLRARRGLVAELTDRTAPDASASAAPAHAALALDLPAGRLGPGSTMTVSGDLLLPATTFNLRNPSIRRTLLSLRAPLDRGPTDSTDAWVVLEYSGGCALRVEWSHEGFWRGSDCRLSLLEPGRWYQITLEATLNTAPGRDDGALRLWVNGTAVLQDTSVRFTDAARPGVPSWQRVRVGATRHRPEVRGGFDLSDGASIDEVRYWDNVGVRARPAGRR